MGSLTNYGEEYVLKHLCAAAQTAPAAIYLALCTGDPGEAATGASMSEVSNANGYTRKAITFNAAAARKVEQAGLVTFDAATGAWGTVSHWALVDSATYGAGNALAYGQFTTSKSVVNGNTPSVAAGEVEVEFTTGAFSNTFVHAMLNHMFRNVAYTQPATYAGLTTTVASDTAGGTEVSGGAYARVLVNKAGGASPAWEAVASSATQNANAITFPTATGAWGTVVSAALYDALTNGNMLVYLNDVEDQAVASGDTVQFAAGALDISLS